MSQRLQLLVITTALLTLTSCATNPATGKRQIALVSEQQEIALGDQADRETVQSLGLLDDRDLQSYVSDLGLRMAKSSERPNLPWTFRAVDDPAVNAFALPGGHIFVTRGLLTHLGSEAELASVLGHEIGHVTARHSVEQMSKAQLAQLGLLAGAIARPDLAGSELGSLAQAGLGLLFLKYGRDDERQADDLGLRYINQQRYDPREMASVFETLRRVGEQGGQGRVPNWMSTHPAPEDRRRKIEAEIAKANADLSGLTVERGPYLRRLQGLAFGADPREGFFRDGVFYHPGLAFQIRFPDGWKGMNQKESVAATSPQGDAVFALGLAKGQTAEEASQAFFAQQGIAQGDDQRSSLSGFPGVARQFGVQRTEGESLQGIAAFVQVDQRVFQLVGYASASHWRSQEAAMNRAVESFSRLTDRRILAVRPKTLEIMTLPEAMTLSEFARRFPSTVDLQTLAIINQVSDGNAAFTAGALVKRVVGESP